MLTLSEFFAAIKENRLKSLVILLIVLGGGSWGLWKWYLTTPAVPEGAPDPAWRVFLAGVTALAIVTIALMYFFLPRPLIWFERKYPLLTWRLMQKTKRRKMGADDILMSLLTSLALGLTIFITPTVLRQLEFEQLMVIDPSYLINASGIAGGVIFVVALILSIASITSKKDDIAGSVVRRLNKWLRHPNMGEAFLAAQTDNLDENTPSNDTWLIAGEYIKWQHERTRQAKEEAREEKEAARLARQERRGANRQFAQSTAAPDVDVEEESEAPPGRKLRGDAQGLFAKVGQVEEGSPPLTFEAVALRVSVMVIPLIAIGVLVNLGLPFPRWGWAASAGLMLVLGAALFWQKVTEFIGKAKVPLISVGVVGGLVFGLYLMGGGSLPGAAPIATETPTVTPTLIPLAEELAITEQGSSLTWEADLFAKEAVERAVAEAEAPINHLNSWVAILGAKEQQLISEDRDLLNVSVMLGGGEDTYKGYCSRVYNWVYRGLPDSPELEKSYLDRLSAQAALSSMPQANPLMAASKDISFACDSLQKALEEIDTVYNLVVAQDRNVDNVDKGIVQERWRIAEGYLYEYNDAADRINRKMEEVGGRARLNRVETLITTLRGALDPKDKVMLATPTMPAESNQINPTATLAAAAEGTPVAPVVEAPIPPEGCAPEGLTNPRFLGTVQNLMTSFQFMVQEPAKYIGAPEACGNIWELNGGNTGWVIVAAPEITVTPGEFVMGTTEDGKYRFWKVTAPPEKTPTELLYETTP